MARLIGNTIVENFDRFTGEPFNANKISKWHDGSDMDDSKVDNAIYFKCPSSLGGGYALREFTGSANIRWFGAKGDGTTDDTPAFQKSIDSGITSLVLESGKKYLLKSELLLHRDSFHLDLNGAEILLNFDDTGLNYNYFIKCAGVAVEGAVSDILSIGKELVYDSTSDQIFGKFEITDTSLFNIGDVIEINYITGETGEHTPNNFLPLIFNTGEILKIDRDNHIVYTDYYSDIDFTTLLPIETSGYIQKISTRSGIVIDNGVVANIGSSPTQRNGGLFLDRCENIRLSNLTFRDLTYIALQTMLCRNAKFSNIKYDVKSNESIGDIYYITQNLGAFRFEIDNVAGAGNVASVDFSKGSAFSVVRRVITSDNTGGFSAIQLHGECEHDISYYDCYGTFSFANNCGEFTGFSQNIQLYNCKGLCWIVGCNNLRLIDCNFAIYHSSVNDLRTYRVEINGGNAQFIRGASGIGASRGGKFNSEIKIQGGCTVSAFTDDSENQALQVNFKQLDSLVIANSNVVNNKTNCGPYIVCDRIKDIKIIGNILSDIVFSIRSNSQEYGFNEYVISNNVIKLSDAGNAVRSFTTLLSYFVGFSQIGAISGKFIVKDNKFTFDKSQTDPWFVFNFRNIPDTSNLRALITENYFAGHSTASAILEVPFNDGIDLTYASNHVDPEISESSGSYYRLSNIYPIAPTSGRWRVGDVITNGSSDRSFFAWACRSIGPIVWDKIEVGGLVNKLEFRGNISASTDFDEFNTLNGAWYVSQSAFDLGVSNAPVQEPGFLEILGDMNISLAVIIQRYTTVSGLVYSRRRYGATTTYSNWMSTAYRAWPTVSRPDSPIVGEHYLDTTLGKPIWFDGTNWVDANGTTV